MATIQGQQTRKKQSLEKLARFSRVQFEQNQVFVQPNTSTKKSSMTSTDVRPPDSDLFAFKQRVVPKMSDEMKNVMCSFNMSHLTPRGSTNAIAEDSEEETVERSTTARKTRRKSEAHFQNRLDARRKQSVFEKLPKLPTRKSLHSVTRLATNVHSVSDRWRPKQAAWSESSKKELERSASDDLYSSRTRQLLERSSHVYSRIDDLQKVVRSASLDSPFVEVVSLHDTQGTRPRSRSARSINRRGIVPIIELDRARSDTAPSEYSYNNNTRTNQSRSHVRLAGAKTSTITDSVKQLSLDENATEMNRRRKENGLSFEINDISVKTNLQGRRRSQTFS